MNLEPTDERLALRDTVRRFMAARADVSSYVRPRLRDRGSTRDDVWRGLVDLGVTSLLIPREQGGEGSSMIDMVVVAGELGAALYPGPWLSTAVAAPRAMLRFGADGRRTSELCTRIADGSMVAAVAEPTDAPIPVLNRHGDSFVVTGTCTGVTDADVADSLLVIAAGPRPTLCEVSLADPAVTLVAEPGMDPTRPRCRVVLDEAAAEPLGTAGHDAIEALADDLVIGWAADALGAADRILDIAVAHATVRRQFGAPIGSFQAVAHLCVDMYETVELVRGGVMYASWAASCADRRTRHLAALRLRAFSGRLAAVGDVAIQIFGGIGFTWEHDAHLHLRRLLDITRHLGPPGECLERLGRNLVDDMATPGRTR